MRTEVKRIFVEKKPGFDIEAKALLKDMKENLSITALENLRLVNCYHISGVSQEEFNSSKGLIFSEKTVDNVYDEFPISSNEVAFAVEFLPGQYDQRADSAAECVQLLTQKYRPTVLSSKIIILQGKISETELDKIKNYCINPVDSRETSIEKLTSLQMEINEPEDVVILKDFINKSEEELQTFMKDMGLAMNFEDLKFCQQYFANTEKRDPSYTEIKVIDTYWSDHCRHTTFSTEITDVTIEEGKYTTQIAASFNDYLNTRKNLYGSKEKPITLMDIAVLGMKELRSRGLLEDLDVSEEINACSIKAEIEVDGKKENWLIMFKNETHNHPTEIEPFGGAATCLGGAIRDPLSGRSYVYQAMRVTGSGDPRKSIDETLPGKLPQRKISTGAAHGYSSYGNQIGLATGQVTEIYHEGYVAKRMEVGAVIGAAPAKNVVRLTPEKGDKIILLGGRTGRDGCGGATGSSKQHTEESILTCGAEVQKGNPPTERKIQRLFRNEEVSTLIKRCNDFGAGGVSVAIGELADGLNINLDLVPKKYEGLDGTELAISESQERMAVVVRDKDVDTFIAFAKQENLEAVVVAEVTDNNRLTMKWRDRNIVDLSRDFLNTNGAKAYTEVKIEAPKTEKNYFAKEFKNEDIKNHWIDTLKSLNVCSQKGLSERFDSTIGAGTVLMPFGGKYQLTPSEGMAAKVPVLHGETLAATLMTHGYNPDLAAWSPYHGAVYAIVESVAKIVALGGDYSKIRLSLQEYFERLGKDASRWGKPFSALLGALYTQKQFDIAAIGGKDSMSGSFNDLDVPPTVVSFAVALVDDCQKIVSQEFKNIGSAVVLLKAARDEQELPVFSKLKVNFVRVNELINNGSVEATHTVKAGGICEAISKMSFGNKIGFKFSNEIDANKLFAPDYGSLVLELKAGVNIEEALKGLEYTVLGETCDEKYIYAANEKFEIDELIKVWTNALEYVFPANTGKNDSKVENKLSNNAAVLKKSAITVAKPRVFIPVFPGTNCEYDSARVFEKAGAEVNTFVFKNLTYEEIPKSVETMVKEIQKAQIIMLPGGFSAGDEPDGSGKFIATVFRNPKIKEAVMELLKTRDGLMLGICNGFQALIKLGLVPYGEIRDLEEDFPTLTYNEIGRHVSCMVNTKIVSKLSPWFANVNLGDIHTVPVSHGEGRFVGKDEVIKKLFENGQVATQYVDLNGEPTLNTPFNPNGSFSAIEGITSPDGRILGKMAHSERLGAGVHTNIIGSKDQRIFEAGVNYFK